MGYYFRRMLLLIAGNSVSQAMKDRTKEYFLLLRRLLAHGVDIHDYEEAERGRDNTTFLLMRNLEEGRELEPILRSYYEKTR